MKGSKFKWIFVWTKKGSQPHVLCWKKVFWRLYVALHTPKHECMTDEMLPGLHHLFIDTYKERQKENFGWWLENTPYPTRWNKWESK